MSKQFLSMYSEISPQFLFSRIELLYMSGEGDVGALQLACWTPD